MIKRTLLLVVVLGILWTECSFSDIETDKVAHVGVCYAITDIGETKLGMDATWSFLTVLGVGIAKELSDPMFDNNDLLADVIGWGLKRLVFEVKF